MKGLLARLATLCLVVSCGETRRPIGEECLRSEDCLSGECSARVCVPQPPLVTGASPPPEEEPRLPSDAGFVATDPTRDAGGRP